MSNPNLIKNSYSSRRYFFKNFAGKEDLDEKGKAAYEDELRNIYRSKLGMSGAKFESGVNSWKRNYDSSSGADIGYLEHEYMQNLDYASKSDLLFLEKEINNDQYLNNRVREKLLKEVDKKKLVID